MSAWLDYGVDEGNSGHEFEGWWLNGVDKNMMGVLNSKKSLKKFVEN